MLFDCINHLFLSTVWPGYLYYSLVTSHFTLHPPGPTHSSQVSLYSTVITKQSSESEWRVMACTLWLHKARPGKHTFSSHRLIIRAFCTGDKRESERRDLATQTQPGSVALITSHPTLGKPCLCPALLQQEHGHTITLIQAVLDFTFRNTDHSPLNNICSGVWMFHSFLLSIRGQFE